MKAAEEGNPKLKAYLADIRAARGERNLHSRPTIRRSILSWAELFGSRRQGSNWTSSFDVMATMRWNLFNSGADKAETEAAESRIRQARQTAYNFFDDLNLEIADTWTRYGRH
ncbi:MAG: TolC family protein [Bilophila wadsworthia]